MKAIIESIEQEIKRQFQYENTGHDWYHIDRVRKIALKIQEQERGDKIVIELAALLHDISDHKFNGGDFELGGRLAGKTLEKFGVGEDIKRQVMEIVKNVSYKGSGVEDRMNSLEGQ